MEIKEIMVAATTEKNVTTAPDNSTAIKLSTFIDDGNDLITADNPYDNQRAEIKKMKASVEKGEILYGKVVGLEVTDDMQVRLIIKRETLRIVIPAEDFFAHSNMKDLDKDSPQDKYLRYRRKGSHMFNAAVSFIPKAMGKDKDGIPFVIASRKEAMDKKQERYFFGPKANVRRGSVATASIISSGERYVTVECLGVESVIGTGALSAFEYIEDASKKFSTGDGLVVAVENLEVDKENRTVSVDFSHAMVERAEAKVECANDRMLNGRYLATVVATIPKYYVVIITGMKIRGLIPIESYAGEGALVKGDSVVVLVTGINKEKNMVIGKCMKA